MMEELLSHIRDLENDPSNADLVARLEEKILEKDPSGDEADSLADALDLLWRKLSSDGYHDAAARLIEMELMLVQDPQRSASLYEEEAQIFRKQLLDDRSALEKFKKALSLAPDNEAIKEIVSEIEAERSNWEGIAARYEEEARRASDAKLKLSLLCRAAELVFKNSKDRSRPEALLRECLDLNPTDERAIRLTERVFRETGNWAGLAELDARIAAETTSNRERVERLLAAAEIHAGQLGSPEVACRFYTQVLDVQPANDKAIRFLTQYYESKEDWDRLASMYERALTKHPQPETEKGLLVQVGMLHWKVRGDLGAAEEHFKRLRKLDPAHPGLLNFYRSFAAEKNDWTSLVQVLSEAQRAAQDPETKDKISRELAEVSGGRGGNPDKAVEAWKSVLKSRPNDAEAVAALKQIYRSTEKWNALVEVLKGELEATPKEDTGRRIALMKEMVPVFRDKLSQDVMVINTYSSILDLDPTNQEAITALTELYEKLTRWNDLIKILSKAAEITQDRDQRIALLMRAARLWMDRFNNLNKAVEPLERILEIDPRHPETVGLLKTIYTKRRAWKPLLDVYGREVDQLEGEEQIKRLAEMAIIYAERLNNFEESSKIWWKVLEKNPENEEALSSLEWIAERQHDWKGLADVLERTLTRVEDKEKRVELLTKLGNVYKDRLKDIAKAADAWGRILAVEPENAKALRMLKDSFLESGDFEGLEKLFAGRKNWEGLVEVLGTAADRAEEPELKVRLSFRAAEIFTDPIGEPLRASRSYERVLSVDPKNERAARELVPIYLKEERWSRLLSMYEILFEHEEDNARKREIMKEIRDVARDKLSNRQLAFTWAARLFESAPKDAEARDALEACAESAGAWAELHRLYNDVKGRLKGNARLDLERRAASIAAERLGHVDQALEGYRAILEKHPGDVDTLLALDRIYRGTGQWKELASIYEQRIAAAEGADKRSLLLELGQLCEDALEDTPSAVARYEEALGLFPGDEEILSALERLARLEERWEDLATILRRRMDSASGETRAQVAFQLATLHLDQIPNRPEALKLFAGILTDAPGHAETLTAMEPLLEDPDLRSETALLLEPHLRSSGDFAKLCRVLEIRIGLETDASKRNAMRLDLVEVRRSKLGDERGAFDTLIQALAESPADPKLWGLAKDFGDAMDNWAELAGHLEKAFAAADLMPELKKGFAFTIAQMYDLSLSDPAKAEPYYQKVLEIDPGSDASFDALENFYTTQDAWQPLLGLYTRTLAGIPDPDRRMHIFLKRSFVEEEILADYDAAIISYLAVLEIDPTHDQALRALATLYENTGRWRELSQLIERQIESAPTEETPALFYRLGEIREQHLDDAASALEQYEMALSLEPHHIKAQEALENLLRHPGLRQRAAAILRPVYEDQGAAANLSRVLEVQLEDDRREPSDKVELYHRLADLHERRLGDPDAAFRDLASALRIAPEAGPTRADLARIAQASRKQAEYAGLLCDIAGSIDEKVLAGDYLSEAARLFDTEINDTDQAERCYRRLIDLDPMRTDAVLPATLALERIYTGRNAWSDLVLVLRIRTGFLESALERKQTLFRVAEIEEAMLENPEAALSTYREIHGQDPSDLTALAGLERLYDRTGRWADLVDALKTRLGLVASADERRDLLLRIADLQEIRLENTAEAVASLCDALKEGGPDRFIHASLARLYGREEKWTDLLDILEQDIELISDDHEKAAVLYRMGSILLKQGHASAATERFREILAIDPGHAETRQSLEAMLADPAARKLAVKLLQPIAERERNHARLIELAVIESEDAEDPAERSRHLRRAARTAEEGLGDRKQAFDFLCRAVPESVADPDLVGTIEHLERLAEAVDGIAALVALYRETAPDVMDGDLQTRLYGRIADLSLQRLDDLETAKEYYIKVLDNAGDHFEAMAALENIYRRTGAWQDLLDIYRRQLDHVRTPDDRIAILMRQAELSETELQDLSGAITAYESVLAERPDDEAATALERLYEKAERWADLFALVERRLAMPDADAVGLHHRLGVLSRDRLDDVDQALEHFRICLEKNPDHEPTILALESLLGDRERRPVVAGILEPIFKARMDWPRLVEAKEARLQGVYDPEERRQLLMEIGTLFEEQLEDLDKAFDIYGRLFKENIEDEPTHELLSRLASVLDTWERLAALYSSVLEDVVGDSPATVRLAMDLGEIYESKLDRRSEARQAYKRVFAFDPSNLKAFSALERLYLKDRLWPELIAHYRTAADTAAGDEERVDYLCRIGRIQEESLEDLAHAIEVYEEVLAVDQDNVEAIAALDRLYGREERWGDLADLIRRQMEVADGADTRHALLCRLAEIHEQKLKDLPGAIDNYEEVLRDNLSHPDAVAALERMVLNEEHRYRISKILEPIYQQADEWRKLVVIYDAQLEFIQDKAERVDRLREIADIHESRGGDLHLAFAALSRAFFEDPGDDTLVDEMARLGSSLKDWPGLVKAFRAGIDNLYDIDAKVKVLKIIARTEDQKIENPRAAIVTYREVLELAQGDAETLDALEALYNLVSDWEGLADILERKAAASPDDETRAGHLRRIGSLHEELLNRVDEAIDAYTRSLDLQPQDPQGLSALERLYQRAEKWIDLVEIYRRKLDIAVAPDERRDLLASIASVSVERLDNVSDAIAAYRQILDEMPGDREALAVLRRLYRKEEMFQDLLETLDTECSLAVTSEERADLLFQSGLLLEKEIAEPAQAVEKYHEVLSLEPANAKAIEALERLSTDEAVGLSAIDVLEPIYRAFGRWDELARLLDIKIKAVDDPQTRIGKLLALAEIHEAGRGDPTAAFETFKRALLDDPSSEAIRDSLHRLAAQINAFGDLAETYERVTQDLYDPLLSRNLFLYLGNLYEAEVRDRDKAVSAYRRALDTGLAEEPALKALDRLYSGLERWPELAEILEREVAAESEASLVSDLEIRLGELRERIFDEPEGALDAYRSVAERDPKDRRPVEALERFLRNPRVQGQVIELLDRLYEQRGEPEKRASLFDIKIENAESDSARVDLLRDLARLREEVLQDPASAFDTLGRAFRRSPGDEEILSDLERLAQQLGSWERLAEIVEQALGEAKCDPELDLGLRLKVAEWNLEKLGDPARAELAYRAILERDPENATALGLLEEVLVGLGRFDEVLDVMRRRAAVIYDPEERKAKLLAAARIALTELGRKDLAAEFHKSVLEMDENDPEALAALSDYMEENQAWKELADLLERRARITLDGREANRLRHRAAAVVVGPLKESDKAVNLYREILDTDPTDAEAVTALEALFEKGERWDDLAEIRQRRLDESQDKAERIALRKGLARLHEEKFGKLTEAVDEWRNVLLEDAEDREAMDALQRILEAEERWDDLIELWNDASSRARMAGDKDRELRLIVRIGEIYDQRLGDSERAVEYYERVLEESPGHTAALAALARLHGAAGDWEKCASVLRQAAEGAKAGPDAAEVHYRIAMLELEHGAGETAAEAELQKAIAFDKKHLPSIRALGAMYRKRGDAGGLADMLEMELGQISDPAKAVPILEEIAELKAKKLNDAPGAVAALEWARDLDPKNRDVLLKLSESYLAAGRQKDAIPVLERLVDEETEGGKKKPKRVAVFLHRLAKAKRASGDLDGAMRSYEEAYKIDLGNPEVLSDLGQIYYGKGDFESALKVLRALLLQRGESAGDVLPKADVYWFIGDIYEKQGDPRKAKGMYQRGAESDPSHQPCKDALARLK